MRKIKRWKQGIAITGVIALSGSLLTGCGDTGKKSSGSGEKTGNEGQTDQTVTSNTGDNET